MILSKIKELNKNIFITKKDIYFEKLNNDLIKNIKNIIRIFDNKNFLNNQNYIIWEKEKNRVYSFTIIRANIYDLTDKLFKINNFYIISFIISSISAMCFIEDIRYYSGFLLNIFLFLYIYMQKDFFKKAFSNFNLFFLLVSFSFFIWILLYNSKMDFLIYTFLINLLWFWITKILFTLYIFNIILLPFIYILKIFYMYKSKLTYSNKKVFKLRVWETNYAFLKQSFLKRIFRFKFNEKNSAIIKREYLINERKEFLKRDKKDWYYINKDYIIK